LALAGLGLTAPALSRACAYLDALADWSPRVNLTAARTSEQRVRLLVAEVLPALNHIEPGTLLDVGSGNGSPGLVLALLREDLQVTLLEPRVRRWAFLREAVRRTGALNVTVIRARHDQQPPAAARTVTLRALALPLAEIAPHVAPGGRVLVFGRPQLPLGPLEPLPGSPAGVALFRRNET
jgi:16S rRNA (guanine527-N7)-methyltransferase